MRFSYRKFLREISRHMEQCSFVCCRMLAGERHLRIGHGNNRLGAQSSIWHVGGSHIAEYYTLA